MVVVVEEGHLKTKRKKIERMTTLRGRILELQNNKGFPALLFACASGNLIKQVPSDELIGKKVVRRG